MEEMPPTALALKAEPIRMPREAKSRMDKRLVGKTKRSRKEKKAGSMMPPTSKIATDCKSPKGRDIRKYPSINSGAETGVV